MSLVIGARSSWAVGRAMWRYRKWHRQRAHAVVGRSQEGHQRKEERRGREGSRCCKFEEVNWLRWGVTSAYWWLWEWERGGGQSWKKWEEGKGGGRLGEVWSHLGKKVGRLKQGTECLCLHKQGGFCVCLCMQALMCQSHKSRYVWVGMHRDFTSTKFTSSTYMQQPHSHTHSWFWQRSMHEYA